MSLLAVLGLPVVAGRGRPPNPRRAGRPSVPAAFADASAPDASDRSGDESTYHANLRSVEVELNAMLAEKAPDAASAEAQRRLAQTRDLMNETAAGGDFDQATVFLDELPGLMDDYRKARDAARARRAAAQAAAKVAYERKLAQVGPRLSQAVVAMAADPVSKQRQEAIREAHAAMIVSATTGDHVAAAATLEKIAPRVDAFLDGVAAQAQAKAAFEPWFAKARPGIQRAVNDLPTGGPPVAIHEQLVTAAYDMEIAANRSDFVGAEALRPTLGPLIERYRQSRQEYVREVAAQTAAQKAFDARIGAIEAGLARVAVKPGLDAETKSLHQEIDLLAGQLVFARMQGSFVFANQLLDELGPLIERYEPAWAKADKDPKVNYGRMRAALDARLKGALAPPRTDPVMVDLQKKVAALDQAATKSATAAKYEAALQSMKSLAALLDTFAVEDRKTPHPCDWLSGVGLALLADAQSKFNTAANKLDDLANAYDRALKAHQEALAANKEPKKLLDTILDIVFMVALPGAIGGAVANGLKKWLGKPAAEAMAGGAFVDGTKDVMKFVTKVGVEQLGGKPPAAVTSVLQGSGVTLTRSIVGQLRLEQNVVLAAVKDLGLLLKDKAEECAKGKPIRVEGDPSRALADDPFFKVIDAMGSADQKGFATEIWRAWIDVYAYRLEERATLTAKPRYRVEQAFADSLIPAIQSQVSSGFDVKRALESAAGGMRSNLKPNGEMQDIA